MAADAERAAARAARIKQLREGIRDPETGKKLSQAGLANEIHVSYRTVQNWEHGHELEDENLKTLAEFFTRAHGRPISEDYIEWGVTKRISSETPDPFPSSGDRLGKVEMTLTRIEQKLDQLILEDSDRYSALTKQERELLERFEELIQQIGRDIGRGRPQSRGAKPRQAASA